MRANFIGSIKLVSDSQGNLYTGEVEIAGSEFKSLFLVRDQKNP